MAYFDMSPDGRIVPNDSFGYRMDPSSIFPRLPKDETEAKNGWKDVNTRQDRSTDFKRSGTTGAGADESVFEGVQHSSFDKIYLMSSKERVVFDTRRGVVKQVDTENTQDYGFHGKGTGTETLMSLEEQDAGKMKTLAEESEHYFEANQKYQDLLAMASKDADDGKDALARAETLLKDAKE
jgi:hypothetical protein